jgi:hypothetical protein
LVGPVFLVNAFLFGNPQGKAAEKLERNVAHDASGTTVLQR